MSPVTFRLPDEHIKLLQQAAQAQTRTRSLQVAHYVRRGLIADGLLVEASDDHQRGRDASP